MGEIPVDVEEQELPGVNPFIASPPRHPPLDHRPYGLPGTCQRGVPVSAHQAELEAVLGDPLLLIP